MSEPKQPSCAKPTSSSTTITTFGAPAAARGRGCQYGVDSQKWRPMTPRNGSAMRLSPDARSGERRAREAVASLVQLAETVGARDERARQRDLRPRGGEHEVDRAGRGISVIDDEEVVGVRGEHRQRPVAVLRHHGPD